jgi:FO synthase
MHANIRRAVDRAGAGARLDEADALALAGHDALPALLAAASARRDATHGTVITYSPKVFIPLTHLCRDVCRYCTFARTPRPGEPAYLSVEQAVAIAEAGAAAGCHEALFTLGDQPERRYRAAREALAVMGHDTTLGYLAEVARAVHARTGLLPHLNPGVMTATEVAALRPVSVSMGLMLESTAERLCAKGGPHHGCPDKHPAVRLATLAAAGEQAVPFTSGILVGIGETPRERIEALLALRDLHEAHGHLQEVIVQNFRAKPDTAMAGAPEPALDEHLWSIAVARLVLPPEVTVQAPPNLNAGALDRLLAAGIDDFGGVSPVTRDHVNPEAPWPALAALSEACEAAGRALVPRLAIHPRFLAAPERWLAPEMRAPALARSDARGLAREDAWVAGDARRTAPSTPLPALRRDATIAALLDAAEAGERLEPAQVARLLDARGGEVAAVRASADRLRRRVSGDTVGYVVNRNINYTNLCYFGCRFCAFSKGKRHTDLRGQPYDLSLEEIGRRTAEAWARGATEVCLQGGIHPDYDGETYLQILRAVKSAAAQIHVHAFSPLEVWQGAASLGMPLEAFLAALKAEGLGSLPGTAAEVLDDGVRAILCPDKIDTRQWLEVMETAHGLGLRSTATLMFGHVDTPEAWARHLLAVRDLAARSGGFTEFVPLPYVHMESPLYRQGRSRKGPTWREALLVHAVARLVLHPHVRNIQASWVKMGPAGVEACLAGGANDAGGTLMNESITRAAGAAFGEEVPPAAMEALIHGAGRAPRQRTTLYADAPPERVAASFAAAPLTPPENTPPRRAPRRRRELPVRFGTG